MANAEGRRFSYGVIIIIACALIEACGIGGYVAYGVFIKPLIAEFGWSRATISGAASLAYLVMGTLGILAGSVNDRFGPRVVMLVSGLFFGSGFLLLSTLNAMWQLYVFYGLIVGIGLSSIDVIALTVTARWFVRRRGLATGIVKVGTGMGQLILPLLCGFFILNHGWRHAFVLLGVILFFSIIGTGLLVRRDPGNREPAPDGAGKQAYSRPHASESGLTLRQAASTPQLWLYSFINFVVMSCMLTILMHIVPHASDVGLDPIRAAGVVSTIGGVSIAGRLVTGIVSDRIGTRTALSVCFALLLCAFLWLQVARTAWMLYLFAAIYGTAHGTFFTLISPTVARLFGIKAHGVLLGIVLFAGNFGGSIGPVVAGHIFDLTQSYSLVFLLLAGLCSLALLLTPFLKPAVRNP